MDQKQFLLLKIMEECSEISQRASKALQFGMNEIQSGQDLTNQERLQSEIDDLLCIVELFNQHSEAGEGFITKITSEQLDAKRKKLNKFLVYSKDLGVLNLATLH